MSFLKHRRFNPSQINDVTLLQAVGAETGQSYSSSKKDKLPTRKHKQPSISSYINHLCVLNLKKKKRYFKA